MNRILTAAALAAATTAASWAVMRLLDARSMRRTPRKPPLESWENEGGALAPQHAQVETSQVPR